MTLDVVPLSGARLRLAFRLEGTLLTGAEHGGDVELPADLMKVLEHTDPDFDLGPGECDDPSVQLTVGMELRRLFIRSAFEDSGSPLMRSPRMLTPGLRGHAGKHGMMLLSPEVAFQRLDRA